MLQMALFGLWGELWRYRNIPDILQHFEVTDEVWTGVTAHLGDPGNRIALLSAIPRAAVVTACGLAQTVNGPLSPLEATQVGLVWRMSRRVVAYHAGVSEVDYVDEDPWSSEQDKAPEDSRRTSPQGTSGLKENVLKWGH